MLPVVEVLYKGAGCCDDDDDDEDLDKRKKHL